MLHARRHFLRRGGRRSRQAADGRGRQGKRKQGAPERAHDLGHCKNLPFPAPLYASRGGGSRAGFHLPPHSGVRARSRVVTRNGLWTCPDRKSVVEGKGGAVRVDLGVRRNITKKKERALSQTRTKIEKKHK